MFGSVFAFHYLQSLTYDDEEPASGFNHLHLKYFVGTYLVCVCYLQAYKWWKAGSLRPVKYARLPPPQVTVKRTTRVARSASVASSRTSARGSFSN
jgi:hypothetical protein